jgi:hypothetical protein
MFSFGNRALSFIVNQSFSTAQSSAEANAALPPRHLQRLAQREKGKRKRQGVRESESPNFFFRVFLIVAQSNMSSQDTIEMTLQSGESNGSGFSSSLDDFPR